MEEARIKMVGEPSWAKENVVTAIIRLVRESGFFATFGGLPAMLSKQVLPFLTLFPSAVLILFSMHIGPLYNG